MFFSAQTCDVDSHKMAFCLSPTVETFGITMVEATVLKFQGTDCQENVP